MSKIYVVIGEHQTVPGIVVTAHRSALGARGQLVKLVGIMAKDSQIERVIDLENAEATIEELQDKHGAAHCGVDVLEVELEE